MTREEALQVLRERMDYYEREKRMRAAIEVLVPEFAEKPVDTLDKNQYVEKFCSLCDSYEIKLPNRAYDIYHLCNDLAKLFGNTNNKE